MLSTTTNPPPQIDNQIDDITVNNKELLTDLLDSDRSLNSIALTHKLTHYQLLLWMNQPAVQSLLQDLDAAAIRRSNHKAAQARQGAVTVLSEHALAYHETPRDRETANKAARALLRINLNPNHPNTTPAPTPPDSRRIKHILNDSHIPTSSLPLLPTPHQPTANPSTHSPQTPVLLFLLIRVHLCNLWLLPPLLICVHLRLLSLLRLCLRVYLGHLWLLLSVPRFLLL